MDDPRTLAVDIGGTGLKLALLDGAGQMIGKRVRVPTPAPPAGPEAVTAATGALQASGLAPRLMVDCSHANSGKDHVRQVAVAEEVAAQVSVGQTAVAGVMLESFLVEGRQDHEGKNALTYGQSITDACMSWERSVAVLDELADAARARRSVPA
jgi:3-deoxy-7-phosphoheptulonate synthase